MFKQLIPAVGFIATAAATQVQAAPTVFFGENQTPANMVSGAPLLAHDAFASTLSGVGTETFSSFPFGTTAPLPISFPGSTGGITATITGAGEIAATPDVDGRFNTTGATAAPVSGNWWEVTGSFVIGFSDPIAAFGFYGTDIGDFNGQVTVALLDTNGLTTNLTISNTVNGNSGSLLFWGFTDTTNSYTQITFANTAAGTDFFGFDDMIVGDSRQISVVPEPATLALLGIALAGLGFARRRKLH